MYNKILIPTDGSESARKAILHAFELAEMSGADILGISVVETAYRGLWDDDVNARIEGVLRKEAENAIKSLEEDFRSMQEEGLLRETVMETRLLEGNPAQVILDVMDDEEIDLVVIGSSGKHGLDRILSGGITRKVLKSAETPILVVG